jgi:hypothetical protein
MAWSGGTFTRTNGVNTGATTWATDAAAGVKIRSDRHDTHDQDLATGIDACINKDGSNFPASLPVADKIISRPVIKDFGITYQNHGNTGATETIDLENGNVHRIVLDQNTTLTFSNPPATGTYGQFRLIVVQDGTGSRTITWPASVDWSSGVAPTLSTGANDIDVLDFFTVDAGTIWYGSVALSDAS